ncbi:hypothetical protein SDRG_02307 [Saprolegnia diclina VS20]|uniref:Guanylate cyclase domain-containing protein n=1 Tax=Saprolegnia diclina (strain VS20) TaxID=1156394 RepID=T0R275_SAPDV|nr:hypothetical protein SDRG_02307 [Saprolegnia diclina VS20]EQC40410.1 hypothetical protein SDRG_02307 [Saprolegnia diclina VS20]|eukprot:XP_008606109.1 hypothetical protein SDRG_02307 [Saprolegnia diclina VS20]
MEDKTRLPTLPPRRLTTTPSDRRLSDATPLTESLALPVTTVRLDQSNPLKRRSFLDHRVELASQRKSKVSTENGSRSRRLIESSKVTPSYLGGAGQPGYSGTMHRYSLRFANLHLEDIFCRHYRHYVLGKVRSACIFSIVLHLLMGVVEFSFGYTTNHAAQTGLLLIRAAAIALTFVFRHLTFRPWFSLRFDTAMVTYYLVLGLLLLGTSVVVQVASNGSDDTSLYFFYAGRWSQASSLLFIAMLFHSTGLMFRAACLCAWLHTLLMLIVPFTIYSSNAAIWDPQIAFGPVLTAFCMVSTYHNERHVRLEFVLRYNVADDRKRRDDLLETMLPAHIKENLKANRTDGLAEQYDEVSILFCYVSDFGRLSKTTPAIELVKLMNRIFFCFDKATDARGVYKVEAIAETYMCAAGVPVKDPFHHERIADMALMMMYIQQQERWTCQGEEIHLKIGIHSGPVVAGVIGSKTYSYHLFGDTVNTSSRVCSSCLPGKIQISAQTYELLMRSGGYDITPRGKVALKGKGELMLYWLNRKVARPCHGMAGLSDAFDVAEDRAITTQLHRMSSVNATKLAPTTTAVATDALQMHRMTLAFQLKPGVEIPKRLGGAYASNMESSFMVKYNINNMGQFRAALRVGVVVLALTTVFEMLTLAKNLELSESVRSSVLALNVTAVLVLVLVLAYSYTTFFLLHMQQVAGGAVVVVISLLNLNLLLQPTRNFLTANVIYIVSGSLLLRFRFTIAMLVNIFNIVVYLVLVAVIGAGVANIVGYLVVTGFSFSIGQVACYKREIGLRMDFLLKHTLNAEKRKCEELLANMLPSQQYAEALLLQGTIVDELEEVTLLYSDMVGFTALSATLKPVESCLFLNKVYSAFDKHLDAFGVYKMDTVGDAFIVIGGLPNYKSEKSHAIAITAFAIEMLREMEAFRKSENVNLQMRIGIHSGKVVGGVVGIKKPRYLIWGSQTVVANAMESKSLPGHIQISAATHAKLASCDEFKFIPRGAVAIDDSQSIETYFLDMAKAPAKTTILNKYFNALGARRVTTRRTTSERQLTDTLQKAKESNPFFHQLDQPVEGIRMADAITAMLNRSRTSSAISAASTPKLAI